MAADDADGETAPAAEDADDDGLLDVSFPMGGDSDPDDGAPPSPKTRRPATAAADGGDDERAADAVDEGAALRCMGLSVGAHVQGRKVEEFAPLAGADLERSGEGPKGDDGKQADGAAAAGTCRGWRPAPLPLPSWAKGNLGLE